MDSFESVSSAGKIVRKRYEAEFIQQVVGVYHSGVYSTIEECALAYGVHKKTLHGWLERHRKNTSPDSVLQQQSEISRLKKELAQAKMELEILKKASIYFANLAR
jgi:transposase